MAFLARLTGVLLVFGLISFSIAASGAGEAFLHVPSLILLPALVVGGLLVSYRPGLICRAFDAGLTESKKRPAEEYVRYIAVLDRAHQLAWSGGFLLFLMGLIQMLGSLTSPGQIGAGIATGALPLFYGVVLAEFLIHPLKHAAIAASLDGGAQPHAPANRTHRVTMAFVLTGCCFVVVLVVIQLLLYSGPTPGGPSELDHLSSMFDQQLSGEMPKVGTTRPASQPAGAPERPAAAQPARRSRVSSPPNQ